MPKRRRKKRPRLPGKRLAISVNLRSLRIEAGLSQPQLAKKAGVGWCTVRSLEANYKTNPKMLTIIALAKALDVTMGQLCGTEMLWSE